MKKILFHLIFLSVSFNQIHSMNNESIDWYEKCSQKIRSILDADDDQKLRNADVNQFTNDELFIDAASKGAVKCAQWLWTQNLDDEEAQKKLLDSSLYGALENRKFAMANFLVRCGANVKTARRHQNLSDSPLSYFLSRKVDSSEQIAWLLNNGADGSDSKIC